RRSGPGTTAGPLLRTPMHAAPTASGRTPYAFEMRTRSVLPPTLTRGIIRSVWLAKAAPSAGAGAAVQVPTQCMAFLTARPSRRRPRPDASSGDIAPRPSGGVRPRRLGRTGRPGPRDLGTGLSGRGARAQT